MTEQRSFWSTVPGILTGVAAVVTALGGILGFLVKQDVIGSASGEPAHPPVTTTTSFRADGAGGYVEGSSATRISTAVATSTPPPPPPPVATPPTLPPLEPTPPRLASTLSPADTDTAPILSGHDTATPVPASFRVVEVFLRAEPFDFRGNCPVVIRFSGRISVTGGGGTVTYRFVRSDGASAPVKTHLFERPGSVDIEETWTRGEGLGWEQIEILDPQPLASAQATFAITCM